MKKDVRILLKSLKTKDDTERERNKMLPKFLSLKSVERLSQRAPREKIEREREREHRKIRRTMSKSDNKSKTVAVPSGESSRIY